MRLGEMMTETPRDVFIALLRAFATELSGEHGVGTPADTELYYQQLADGDGWLARFDDAMCEAQWAG